MRYAVVLLATLALLLTGCINSGSEFKFQEVTYTLTGGIGGLDMQIVITEEGGYRVTERDRGAKQGKLSSSELAGLRRLAARVKWAALAPEYVDPQVADALLEGIVIKSAGKEYRTVVGTGAIAPQELKELLAHLQVILKEKR